MRFGFPQTLIASLVFHSSAILGLLFFHFHVGTVGGRIAMDETQSPTLILLGSEGWPDSHPSVSGASTSSSAGPQVEKPVVIASPTDSIRAGKSSPPATLALEANPLPNLRSLPSEAVLSPHPAPFLSGRGAIVFVLDVSGSMYESYCGSTRLALARKLVSAQLLDLKDGTPFAVTLYGERVQQSGPLVAASDATRDAAVRFILRDADCGGGTNLPNGLAMAQRLDADSMVIITDGDLNMDPAEVSAKTRAILGSEGHGPALTVIGIAPRQHTLDGRLLHDLAAQQGGIYQVVPKSETGLLTSNRIPVLPEN